MSPCLQCPAQAKLCLAQGDSVLQALPVEPFHARDWAAAFLSQPREFEYWIEQIEGTIPEFLRGTLFRNGPGNFGGWLYPCWT